MNPRITSDLPFIQNKINFINSKTIALFAMHSEKKHIPENSVTYVNFLSEIFDIVIVLTTKECHLRDQSMFPKNIFIKFYPNGGLDFGLWSRALKEYNLEIGQFDSVCLVNDSCHCLKSLKPLNDLKKEYPFWGITDSLEFKHHIQSYFLVINGNQNIKLLIVFFQMHSFETFKDRDEIIQKGEIGLSQFFVSKGIKLHAAYEFSSLDVKFESHLKRSNSSYFYWPLLRQLECPIIKVKKN
jgi:hypothetical protein